MSTHDSEPSPRSTVPLAGPRQGRFACLQGHVGNGRVDQAGHRGSPERHYATRPERYTLPGGIAWTASRSPRASVPPTMKIGPFQPCQLATVEPSAGHLLKDVATHPGMVCDHHVALSRRLSELAVAAHRQKDIGKQAWGLRFLFRSARSRRAWLTMGRGWQEHRVCVPRCGPLSRGRTPWCAGCGNTRTSSPMNSLAG